MKRRFKDRPRGPAQSILTLTENPANPDAYVIGMALAGQEAGMNRVTKTDIFLLALVNLLKTEPQAFKDEVMRVNDAIMKADVGYVNDILDGCDNIAQTAASNDDDAPEPTDGHA